MTLTIDPTKTTPLDVLRQVEKAQKWPDVDSLLRLDGFDEPWERAIYAGKELKLDTPLSEQGVTAAGAVLVTVRRVLVADGWNVCCSFRG